MFKTKSTLSLVLVGILILSEGVHAAPNATDQELASKLKDELEYDTQRRNDFKNQRQAKKIYEQEREKGLSLFLEEQEKWDITREKGQKEQRTSRLKMREMDETSPEYIQDEKEKKRYEAELETARRKHIQTKKEVIEIFKNKINVTEEEELGVYNERPRYALDQRGRNKWTGAGRGKSSGGFSGSSGGSSGWSGGGAESGAGASAPFDYPPVPNQEYVPSDNFDDLPPPPPMMPYEGYGNPNAPYYEGGEFPPGGVQGYPPPPPDGGWDF